MSRVLVAQSHANVKVAGSYSGLLRCMGKTHLDIEDLAIMRAMPEMTVRRGITPTGGDDGGANA